MNHQQKWYESKLTKKIYKNRKIDHLDGSCHRPRPYIDEIFNTSRPIASQLNTGTIFEPSISTQFIAISFTLTFKYSIMKISSTSNAQPSTCVELNSLMASSLRNNLKPHCVSRTVRTVKNQTIK